MINTKISPKLKRKGILLKTVILVLFSIFLAFMTVYLSLRDHFIRSGVVLLIFVFLYYKFVTERVLNANFSLLNYFFKLLKVGKVKYSKDVNLFHWFITSSLLGLSSIILLVLTGVYTIKANTFYDEIGPNYGYYINIARSIPSNIFIITIIGFLVLFLIHFFVSMKSQSQQLKKIFATLFSTICTLLLVIGVIILGILLYSFIGVWILGGET